MSDTSITGLFLLVVFDPYMDGGYSHVTGNVCFEGSSSTKCWGGNICSIVVGWGRSFPLGYVAGVMAAPVHRWLVPEINMDEGHLVDGG